jgi:hypothetical protein
MKLTNSKLNQKTALLKEARLQLLKLHKLLVDCERLAFEQKNGQLTSGQFLNILINDQDFQWLKGFSTLIVEIDEMFDLDDGVSEEMIENQLAQMEKLLSLNDSEKEFKNKYTKVLQSNSEIQDKHEQLKKLLTDK